MEKKISVCIPTFNGSLFIEEQLKSIISQLDDNDEIIISDDNSTDNTIEKIISLNDTRIKILTNNRLPNPVYNIENALSYAKGDLIFLADQDDIWSQDKVSVMTPLLDKYDLVISDAVVIDQSGNIMYPSFFKINYSGKGFIRNWINNSFMGCCMAFNRKILDYVLPFPEKLAMHDIWIGLNASLVGKCHFLHQPLVYYRRHGRNTVASLNKTYLPVRIQMQNRLITMYRILQRWIHRKMENEIE